MSKYSTYTKNIIFNKRNFVNLAKYSKTLLYLTLGVSCYKYMNYQNCKRELECCGIIGYIGKEKIGVEVCLSGIEILQFRGYDSCGIASYNSEKNEVEITKYASDLSYISKNLDTNDDCIKKLVENVPKLHTKSNISIGHTRWATHGRKIEINAHPHCDESGKIILVHNGIVDSFKELKEFLLSENVKIKSETDTELIAQIIGYYYNTKKLSIKESISISLEKHVRGTYALVIMCKDCPDKLFCVRNGSPILVGVGKDFFIVASDSYAFQKYTQDYFKLEDQNIVELSLESNISNYKIQKSKVEEILQKPLEGYEHFMIQEIMEQPETIKRAMNFGSRFKQIKNNLYEVKLGGLEEQKDYLLKGKNLCIIATGTSFFASNFVGGLFRRFKIFNTVQVIDACEFDLSYLPKDNPLCIFVSQSGESKEVLNAVSKFK